MITAGELASMQHDELPGMPDTASVLRGAPSSSSGGWAQTFVLHHTARARLTGLAAPIEDNAAAEIASVSRWRLVVPVGTDITPSDRIQCNGKTFEVAGAFATRSFNLTDVYYLVEVRR